MNLMGHRLFQCYLRSSGLTNTLILAGNLEENILNVLEPSVSQSVLSKMD